jgi:hypothetical protein
MDNACYPRTGQRPGRFDTVKVMDEGDSRVGEWRDGTGER